MNPAIETRGLTRRFRKQEAVHDLNLIVPVGGACAFLGRNPAGKRLAFPNIFPAR